jgi:hypothetical protein
MQFKDLDKIVRRAAARRHFEAIPKEDLAAEIERLRVDVAGQALRELLSLATDDSHCAEATKRHVEATGDELAGPDASPLARLLARLTATLAIEADVASGRLYRVAGIPGGLETRMRAAAGRWAKSAGPAAVQAGKCLSLVEAVERRESERSVAPSTRSSAEPDGGGLGSCSATTPDRGMRLHLGHSTLRSITPKRAKSLALAVTTARPAGWE